MIVGLTQSDAVRGVPMSFGTTKLYYYTAREQTSEATKKCAECVSPILYTLYIQVISNVKNMRFFNN